MSVHALKLVAYSLPSRNLNCKEMTKNKSVILEDYKYRLCATQGSSQKVVFCCDWDLFYNPIESFIGKPIYFQSARKATMSFPLKTHMNEEFIDLCKISPQSTYLSDLGLKIICDNIAPNLIEDNSHSLFQTLCQVPINNVIKTISSMDIFNKVLSIENQPSSILKKIRKCLPQEYNLGLIGNHAFDPYSEESELDIVVYADNIYQLKRAKSIIDNLPTKLHSGYIDRLWPLSIRTKDYGSLDFFYSTRKIASPIYECLSQAPIVETHYEFEGCISDDLMSILSIPIWILQDGRKIASIDNALRGRFKTGESVTGIGLFTLMKTGDEVIVVQSSNNMRLL